MPQGNTRTGCTRVASAMLATILLSSAVHADRPARFTSAASSSSQSAVSSSTGAPRSSIARVYQCTRDGQRIFSDQPCGTDAQQRDVQITSRMDAAAVRNVASRRNERSRHVTRHITDTDTDSADDKKKRCAKIDSDKENLNARMRNGYGGAQGERLRDRLRKLNDEYFELRCSRYR